MCGYFESGQPGNYKQPPTTLVYSGEFQDSQGYRGKKKLILEKKKIRKDRMEERKEGTKEGEGTEEGKEREARKERQQQTQHTIKLVLFK